MSNVCSACNHPNVQGARYCASCGALMPVVDSHSSDPLIGAVLGGRFRVVGLLGEGGMGRVYTAEQQMGSSTRKVAVKTLLEEFSKDSDVVERFMRECGTVSELEHPNTIKFYDFGRTDGGDLYIAMEMVDGAALSDVIERERALSADRVINVMRQVSGSLQEAHDKGIVHRDLKPDNIILTTRAGQTDFAKVLDFGIAKRSDAADAAKEKKLTQAGMVLGTPPYMSPEQFTGKELDGRSDVYSLGVIAYEMLTGKLPFEANTPWEWATQHMTAQPSPFEKTAPMAAQLPVTLKQAIMRALNKDPELRQASAMEFFAELSGQPAVSTKPAAGPIAGSQAVAPTHAFPSSEIAAVSAAGSSRPGGTQIGSGFAPPGSAAPAVGTAPAVGSASAHAAAGYGAAGPTAPGQGIPVPPATHSSGGGAGGAKIGMIIGAGALAALLVVGGVMLMSGSGGDDEEDPEIIDVSTSASAEPSAAPTEDPLGDGQGGAQTDDAKADASATPSAAATEAKTNRPPPRRPPPPPPPPKPQDGASACNAAIAAALAGRCSQAHRAFIRCKGHRRGIASANVRRCKKRR